MRIVRAVTHEEIDAVRVLFERYAAELAVDLSFQQFESELAGLPGAYAPPHGALFLALRDDAPVGCIAVRPLEPPAIAELKRLYVSPSERGTELGLRLTLAALESAREAGMPATAFVTTDITADFERLTAAGVVFRSGPTDAGTVTTALFEDTCGNIINLVQVAS